MNIVTDKKIVALGNTRVDNQGIGVYKNMEHILSVGLSRKN